MTGSVSDTCLGAGSWLEVPGWKSFAGLRHGFFGRPGGVSSGPFATLNLADNVGDDGAAVSENRRRMRRWLAPLQLILATQVHGGEVEVIRDRGARPPAADALITDQAGIALGVLTADCVPILLAAPSRHVVAVVHAGWRGTAGGIARRVICEMRRQFGVRAREVYAAMGPAIGSCCYEVGDEVVAAVAAGCGPLPADACRPRSDRVALDLRRINAAVLAGAGLPADRISYVGPCTRCSAGAFFSHRAAGGGPTGRQLSCAGWEA